MTLDEYTEIVLLGDGSDATKMAMALLSLMKTDQQKLYTKVKSLAKSNKLIAKKVFLTEVEGWTTFHACALRGTKKLMKLMMATGVDVNSEMGQPIGLPGRCTALHVAGHRGDKKIVDYLLSLGARVNLRDTLGRTPIFYAVEAQHSFIAKRLKDSGADLRGVSMENLLFDECVTPQPKISNFCFLHGKSEKH